MKIVTTLTCVLLLQSLSQHVTAAAPAVTGDVVSLPFPPASVDIGDLESNTKTFFFLERTGVELPANFNVNIVAPGTYQGTSTGDVNSLPEGDLVDSYFVHFDPIGAPTSADPARFSDGSITFEKEVIAIITQDGLLETSESLGFASPTTLYPAPGTAPDRGVDAVVNATDLVQLSPDRHSVSFLFAARNPGDQMRILVASEVPEPVSVLLASLCGVAGMLVRRRW